MTDHVVELTAEHHETFDRDGVVKVEQAVEPAWIDRILPQMEEIAKVYPPKIDIDLRHLAEMLCAIADGGLICGRTLRSPKLMNEQILAYRKFVQAVFAGT